MSDTEKCCATKACGTGCNNKSKIIVLIVLLAVAAGAFVFLSGKVDGAKNVMKGLEGVSSLAGAESKDGEVKDLPVITPGNPVVAKVNGKDITRMDVFNFIQNLPAETRQMSIEKLFPLALEQVVNTALIAEKLKGVNLDGDKAVQAQMKAAKENIVRSVFLQKEADKAVTEDMLKAAYEDYKKNFPKIEEMKARHILVKDEALAKDLIKQIEGGADFAELAKKNSIDATKDNGGELGYFTEQEVVPAFAKAAFAMKVDEVTKKPVKTDFGYHVIKILERRDRPAATFEQAKPYLAAQLRGKVLEEVVGKWRAASKVEVFDINGQPVKADAEKAEAPKSEAPEAVEPAAAAPETAAPAKPE